MSDKDITSEKRQKFVTLAERRVDNAIRSISRIGNLANRHAYEYAEIDVKKIVGTLEAEVVRVKAQFAASKERGTGQTFTL